MSEPTGQGIELAQKCAELSTLILEKHPQMPVLLQEIHKTLRQYPEQVAIMSEEDIAIIVSGLKVQTGVEFAASVASKSPSATKSLKNRISQLGVDAV